jgi:hypothetical protein
MPDNPTPSEAARILGRLGGKTKPTKPARTAGLPPERRREIASNAAKARWETSRSNRAADDFFNVGVLTALGVVYTHGAETIAEDIVRACDAKQLLRAARDNGDPWLKDLKRTVRFLKETGRI